MMDKLFGPFVQGRGAVGLLVVRVVGGLALMLHGWGKIQDPFHWMDKAPSPPPGILQALAALSEFGGGLGLILGLLTPLCALGIACTMVVAVWTHASKGDPFVGHGGGSYEPAAGYLALMILLLTAGPGALSLDARLFGRRSA
jgi:putative oxidoreductase